MLLSTHPKPAVNRVKVLPAVAKTNRTNRHAQPVSSPTRCGFYLVKTPSMDDEAPETRNTLSQRGVPLLSILAWMSLLINHAAMGTDFLNRDCCSFESFRTDVACAICTPLHIPTSLVPAADTATIAAGIGACLAYIRYRLIENDFRRFADVRAEGTLLKGRNLVEHRMVEAMGKTALADEECRKKGMDWSFEGLFEAELDRQMEVYYDRVLTAPVWGNTRRMVEYMETSEAGRMALLRKLVLMYCEEYDARLNWKGVKRDLLAVEACLPGFSL